MVGAFWLKAGLAHASKLGGIGLSTVQHLACRIGGLTRIVVGYVGGQQQGPRHVLDRFQFVGMVEVSFVVP